MCNGIPFTTEENFLFGTARSAGKRLTQSAIGAPTKVVTEADI